MAGGTTPWGRLLGPPALNPGEIGLLDRLARHRELAAGETLPAGSEPVSALRVLVSGDLVLGARDAEGQVRTETSLTGPAWLDLDAAWLGSPPLQDGLALTEVTLTELPITALLEALHDHPALAHRLLRQMALRLREQADVLRNLLHRDAPARLAHWLLLRRASSGDDELHLQSRKRDIAQQLAMTPETLSRLLHRFERDGLISARGYALTLLDPAALRHLAGLVAPD